MKFRGITSFRTENPKDLAVDLEREHNAVSEAFRQTDLEKASRWTKWRKATGETTAALDEAILGDTTGGNFIVKLPVVGGSDVGRAVIVCLSAGSGVITVVPSNGTVNGGGSTDNIDSTNGRGYRHYIWDGQSSWWRAQDA